MSPKSLIAYGVMLASAAGLAWSVASFPARPSTGEVDAQMAAMLAAEDRRASESDAVAPLVAALRGADPMVAMRAVRGLGRMESPTLLPAIASALGAPMPEVRAEAANALAQAVFRGDGGRAAALLLAHVPQESHPLVLGAVAQALGRLRYASDVEVTAAERTMLDASRKADAAEGAPATLVPAARLGTARGFEWLTRANAKTHALGDEAVATLGALAFAPRPEDGDLTRHARTRLAAVAALANADRLDERMLARAVDDRDDQVRRVAASVLGRRGAFDDPLFDRVRHDPAPTVRFEAYRALTRPSARACALALEGVDDHAASVRLRAINSVPAACAAAPDAARASAALVPLVSTARTAATWHAGAHALVALAALDRAAARPIVTTASTDPVWQVRMYAARAATATRDVPLLVTLASDAHHNVREAAITGLDRLNASPREAAARAALTSTDYQLVRTAAGVLKQASDRAGATTDLLAALRRITADERDTSRDPRKAIVDTLKVVGTPDRADALRPYLTDFDPVIANGASAIVQEWTGSPAPAAPRLLPGPPHPTPDDLRRWARTTAVVTMRDLGQFSLRLLPFEAPTNVARFVRMVNAGFFDGLTWHRVEPNFVLQGGSPGANEYAGDGPFTRDELVSSSHVRGTIGISTRGRDTCDGQLFVNLVDNLRLDHNFTIIAEVIDGLEVVDAVLEGAVIERISLSP